VGRQINKNAAATFTRTQLEMGGKNPMIVLADADLEKAADDAILAGFACAGQWCTSTSRLIVEKAVVEELTAMLIERAARIDVGPGTDPKIQMGPVCGQGQLDTILSAIEIGKKEGANLVAGGNRITQGHLEKGCFVEPTIFTNVTPEMYIAQEEIFGPVLCVITASDFEDAIHIANNVKYGLSSSIYTRDLEKPFRFLEQTEVGLTHVNMTTAHKEPQLSFGGVKLSGHGVPESGKTGFEFFSEHKVAYINYS
jgi:aldehyde dehydrogenase (NAD+)